MHKARENVNGSFSIGKSWVLDDLTMIQSYTKIVPTNPEQRQDKERAGAVGFVVTVQKPYYWQASTPKEKDFFIYSLIKIYKKYTGGRLPELHGFDPQELEQLLGAGLASGAPQARNNMTPPSRTENGAPHHGSSTFQGGRPPNAQQFDRSRQIGREMRPRPSPERVAHERPSQARPTQERMLPQSSSQERVLKTTDSTDSIPRMPGSFPTSDFIRNLRPEKSHSQLRDINPELQSGVVGAREGPVPPVEQQEQNPSITRSESPKTFRNRQESQQKGVQGSGRPSGERSRQLGHYAPLDTVSANSSIGRPSSSDRNQLPTPLRSGMPDSWQPSQAVRRERRPSNTSRRPSSSQKHSETEASQERLTRAIAPEVRVSHSRNSSTLGSRQDRSAEPISIQSAESSEVGAQTDITTNEDDHPETTTVRNATANGQAPADSEMSDSVEGLSKASVQSLPEVPPEAIPEAKPHRPGLGPMIKSKPNQDVANKFRKAATAYNAFIPRAGSAAAKVLGEEDNSDKQNDGVSGVYPAPSIGKTINHDSGKPPTAERGPGSETFASEANKSSIVNASTPSVKSPETSADETPMQESSPSNQIPSQIPDVSEIPQDDRRRKRRSDHSAKYAKLLGINHSILEGRTFEIETILNEFGWKEELSKPGAFEDIQLGLKKELAQVEAGSWLGALENSDERVMTIGHMMDKVIAECEELDCLLTLYNVELGVSLITQQKKKR